MIRSVFILFCAGLLSCSDNKANLEKTKQALIAADKSMSDLATKEGFNQALLQYAGDNFVKFDPGNHPVIGKNEFMKKIEGNPGPKSITWVPVKADVSESGDLGYTWGNWKFLAPDTTFYGNYITVWKKQNDGSWKMELDAGSETPAPK